MFLFTSDVEFICWSRPIPITLDGLLDEARRHKEMLASLEGDNVYKEAPVSLRREVLDRVKDRISRLSHRIDEVSSALSSIVVPSVGVVSE